MKPLMSDAELKRRRRVQGDIGRTTSTLGLASVGMLGASVAAKKKPKLLKLNPEKLKNASFGTSITAGGIGGVGGFNQAAIYSAESRKKKPVVKRDEMAPEYGEIAKAWSPVTAKPFDAEEKRHKRNAAAEMVTGGAGGVAVGAGSLKALEGVGQQGRAIRHAKERVKIGPQTKKVAGAGKLRAAGKAKTRTGMGIMAAGAASLGASELIHHKRKSEGWQSYAKSAWGITHD